MDNIYYSPEKFGLSVFAEIDMSQPYEFDVIVVWREIDTGRLLWAHDCGCSCPVPFEGHTIERLEEIRCGADIDQAVNSVWSGTYGVSRPSRTYINDVRYEIDQHFLKISRKSG